MGKIVKILGIVAVLAAVAFAVYYFIFGANAAKGKVVQVYVEVAKKELQTLDKILSQVPAQAAGMVELKMDVDCESLKKFKADFQAAADGPGFKVSIEGMKGILETTTKITTQLAGLNPASFVAGQEQAAMDQLNNPLKIFPEFAKSMMEKPGLSVSLVKAVETPVKLPKIGENAKKCAEELGR